MWGCRSLGSWGGTRVLMQKTCKRDEKQGNWNRETCWTRRDDKTDVQSCRTLIVLRSTVHAKMRWRQSCRCPRAGWKMPWKMLRPLAWEKPERQNFLFLGSMQEPKKVKVKLFDNVAEEEGREDEAKYRGRRERDEVLMGRSKRSSATTGDGKYECCCISTEDASKTQDMAKEEALRLARAERWRQKAIMHGSIIFE
ncbi:hypothetical protein LZ32DRAFT_111722 [Colletotrichum eremochloae]|nr:hypothetical protein LZ32DRAFT_111722 [Colletotrichum eremochloae]